MGTGKAGRSTVYSTVRRAVSAAALADAIAGYDADRVLVARALDPGLRTALSAFGEYEELPFARGRTVLPADLSPGDLVVAGHPNHLGVFDLPEAPAWIAVTGRWSSLAEATDASEAVPMGEPVRLDVAGALLESAVDLAKRLSQLPGVTIAFPPVCPVLVALLPIDPGSVSGEPLTAYPELPGGLRIELGPGVDPEEYAAGVGEKLEQSSEEGPGRWRQPPAP